MMDQPIAEPSTNYKGIGCKPTDCAATSPSACREHLRSRVPKILGNKPIRYTLWIIMVAGGICWEFIDQLWHVLAHDTSTDSFHSWWPWGGPTRVPQPWRGDWPLTPGASAQLPDSGKHLIARRWTDKATSQLTIRIYIVNSFINLHIHQPTH